MYHYKEITPEETIEHVKEYFSYKPNFFLELKENYYNKESQTWWCAVSLYYKGKEYLRQEGKGITEILSLASGYMELFERYCSCWRIYSNPILLRKKPNLKQYNYISLNNDAEYFSLKDIIAYNGTTGFSAGNSLAESVTQGISEIAERYCLRLLFEQYNNKDFYILDNFTLPDKFQQIINNIENIYNTKVFVFDLSYTFSMPVCMVVIFDNISFQIRYRLGSHPIFEIALERCFTELYQHITEKNHYMHEQHPFLTYTSINQEFQDSMMSAQSARRFPEFILLKNIIRDQPSNIFFNSAFDTNTDFINYYKKIFNNLNIGIYYTVLEKNKQLSLYATHVYAPDIKYIIDGDEYFFTKDYEYYRKSLNKFFDKLFNNQLILKDFDIFNDPQLRKYNYWFKIYNDEFIIPSLIRIIKNDEDTLSKNMLQYSHYAPYVSEYRLLREYVNSNKYTDEEIINIFKCFGVTVSKLDIRHINNKIYVLEKYIFDHYIEDYNDFDLDDFLI